MEATSRRCSSRNEDGEICDFTWDSTGLSHRCSARSRNGEPFLLTLNGKNKIHCFAPGFFQRFRLRYFCDSFSFATRGRFGMRFIVIASRRWRRVRVNFDLNLDPLRKVHALSLNSLLEFAQFQSLLLQLEIQSLTGTWLKLFLKHFLKSSTLLLLVRMRNLRLFL